MDGDIFNACTTTETYIFVFMDVLMTVVLSILDYDVFSGRLYEDYDWTTSPLDLLIMLVIRCALLIIGFVQYSWTEVYFRRKKVVMIYAFFWTLLTTASFVKFLAVIIAREAVGVIFLCTFWGLLNSAGWTWFVVTLIWEDESETLHRDDAIQLQELRTTASRVPPPVPNFQFTALAPAPRVQAPAPRVQAPASRVQPPAPRVQTSAPRVQAPTPCAQTPAPRVQAPAQRAQAPKPPAAVVPSTSLWLPD